MILNQNNFLTRSSAVAVIVEHMPIMCCIATTSGWK